MRLACNQFATVARQTSLEASRQPAFLLLTAGTLVMVTLLPVLITHVLGDAGRMIRDSALALVWMAGLLLGCFGAASTISRELRLGTLASILSKPMSREIFFLAKFAGIAAVMAAYTAAATLATLVSVHAVRNLYRVDWFSTGVMLAAVIAAFALAGLRNYLFRSPFSSGAFRDLLLCVGLAAGAVAWRAGGPAGHEAAFPWTLLPAGILIGLAIAVLCGFAVTAATRLDLTGSMILCTLVLLAGLMSDYLVGQHMDAHPALRMLYGILPNWQNFWAVDALNRGTIPWSYVGRVAAYALTYLAGILLIGLSGFRRMEVKG